MRRSLAFITRHRAFPDRPVLRLFWFNDAQAKFFDRAVNGITAGGVPFLKAHELVERVVLAYLQGREPSGEVAKSILLGRSLFPVLSDDDVERLPRSGAPGGRIAVLVFQIEHRKPDGTTAQRAVRFGMNREQADAYNAALWNLQKSLKVQRDEAWHQLNRIVGRLLNGATLTDTADAVVRALAAVFPAQPMHELPDVTEDDVRLWTFTTAPLLSVVSS